MDCGHCLRRARYYSSGSLHGLIMSRPLTLPYHMQQHVSHDMRVALTSGNAWMITNRDSSTGRARRDTGRAGLMTGPNSVPVVHGIGPKCPRENPIFMHLHTYEDYRKLNSKK